MRRRRKNPPSQCKWKPITSAKQWGFAQEKTERKTYGPRESRTSVSCMVGTTSKGWEWKCSQTSFVDTGDSRTEGFKVVWRKRGRSLTRRVARAAACRALNSKVR
jgi:hypothetical protein